MIINLSDPEITKNYHLVSAGESKDWLLLGYSKARDALRLLDSGLGGLDTLRSRIKEHSDDVNFSLLRANESGSLVLISFVPPARVPLSTVEPLRMLSRYVFSDRVAFSTPKLKPTEKTRRAVLSISSETELTPESLEHALHPKPTYPRNVVPEPRLPTVLQRPMSPPRSSEEGRPNNHPLPRVASSSSSHTQERGLPLNLAEPLDASRQQELAKQSTSGSAPGPTSAGIAPERQPMGPRNGKPRLSVAVPPRKERGLRPGGPGVGSYEFDAEDDEDDDQNEDEDDEDEDDVEEDDDQGNDSLVVRLNSRPASRGPTPPPGPSILRHPSPIPSKPELGSSAGAPSLPAHIRFTGPPKDHPHPNHHPLKPTDHILPDIPQRDKPRIEGLPNPAGAPPKAVSSIVELPAPGSTLSQQPPAGPPVEPLPETRPIQAPTVDGVPHTGLPHPPNHQPSAVASTLLPLSVTCPPASQPGAAPSTADSFNGPRPAENSTNNSTEPMPLPKPSSLRESTGSFSQRGLPQLPASVSAISSTPSHSLSPGASSFSNHSRNTSLSTGAGQTHVPSGTLCAFGRRPSVSNNPQGNGSHISSGSVSRSQLEHFSPSTMLERSSTVNTTASTSTSASLRSFTGQTQGMTEAQLQAARSRAKWAAEEQGLVVTQPTPTPPLRSPPLTPPTSPPRSLNVDEAGRVRRDGVEKMRREAERRREEDEKRKLAEQQRQAEIEQQLKLDKEREAREAKERAEQEVKRKEMDLKRRAMEEELGKQRAEERVKARERLAEMKGTDEVFLTGQVNIQMQNSMTWRRRFYELTGNGSLRLYKSSDAPDRVKPLDVITIKGAQSIDHGVEELEHISYAFQVRLGEGKETWSFYMDSQHDIDILTEGMKGVL